MGLELDLANGRALFSPLCSRVVKKLMVVHGAKFVK